jgi:feruloyl esterase
MLRRTLDRSVRGASHRERAAGTPTRIAIAALAAAGTPLAAADECTDLAAVSLTNAEIVAANPVAEGAFEPPGGAFARFGGQAYASLPPFCRVEAIARPAPDSEIGIEVWLPRAGWNGKLLGVGNGAWAGSISHSALAGAVADGYAAASTDTGHKGGSPDFAATTDKLVDFAHRAVHEMTVAARAVTTAYYSRPVERAYFSGCSTGGRQALTAAQRYPEDFDGIVAGAPAYYPSHIQGMQVWTNAVSRRNPDAMLDPDDLRLANEAAVAACDGLDGVEDGVIENPARCGFDPGALTCSASRTDACLSAEQVDTVREVYRGPSDSNDRNLYPGLARGSEAGWATLSGPAPLSLALETYQLLVYDDPDWDYRDFDAEVDIQTASERIGPLLDADDPDLNRFVERGGKLLLYHGWSDPGIPPAGTVRYFESVRATLGPSRTDESVQLYLVPGMGHCAGGTGTDQFDAVAALDDWVERGVAPTRIPAERRAGGEVVRSRPLCPYPLTAAYDGSGSTDDEANFTCR